jgi:hypothetical protein
MLSLICPCCFLEVNHRFLAAASGVRFQVGLSDIYGEQNGAALGFPSEFIGFSYQLLFQQPLHSL